MADKKTKKNNTTKYVIISIILIIAIIFVYTKYFPKEKITKQEVVVIASVNGENITLSDLDKVYNSMPPQLKPTVSKRALLNQLIEARLLYQEAKKQGIIIAPEKIQEQIEQIKEANRLDDQQFAQLLSQQNITQEELIKQYTAQLTVQVFLNETILSKVNATDQEIKDYYNKNKDKFKVDERVSVRHILIGDQNLTTEQQNETAQSFLKEITKDNFCDYVENYSTDVASIENCGEYNFTKTDPYVQEFKDFSFFQPIGKIDVVQTQFGFHIIWIVKKIPPKTLTLNEVKDQITNILKLQKGEEDYKKFYEKLLQRNVINIYYRESQV